MGGTDDPSNLVSLTVEEHAEAHKLLWEEHGKLQDYYAWQGLTAKIGKDDINRELSRYGAYLTNSRRIGKPFQNLSEDAKRNRIENRRNRPCGYNSPEHMAKLNSQESLEKRKKVYAEIGHMQGSKNSQYGTMWITNGTDNKKIKKEDLDKWTSLGYNKGRVMLREPDETALGLHPSIDEV